MRPGLRAALTGAVVLAAAGGLLAWGMERAGSPERAYAAPGLAPMTAEDAAAAAGGRLVPALLHGVYSAFAETEEGALYDRLAQVADGPAIEALYLERMGAMAGGGLVDGAQDVHDVWMVRTDLRRAGDTLEVEAVWDVIGRLAHEDHVHTLGSRYRGALTLAPREGAWKITAFALVDADRSRAGQQVAAEHR